jgi:hypothetical protein
MIAKAFGFHSQWLGVPGCDVQDLDLVSDGDLPGDQ